MNAYCERTAMAHKGKSQSSGNSTLNSGTQPPRISPRLTRVTFIPEFEGGGTLAKPQLDAGGVNQWQNTFLVCARLGFHPNTAKIKKKKSQFWSPGNAGQVSPSPARSLPRDGLS
jgi:hypothetical protein